MNRVGDLLAIGGIIDIPVNTPIVLAGDFYVYVTDPAYHLVTLLAGDIIDKERYGADITLDWMGLI